MKGIEDKVMLSKLFIRFCDSHPYSKCSVLQVAGALALLQCGLEKSRKLERL